MTDAPKPLTGGELQAMLDHSPFIAFLGLKVTEADPAKEQVTMTCAMRPEFERGKGTGQWHGGPIAAIIDTVGDYALIMALRRGLPTINFRVDYLRPAIKTALTTTARVRRAGKSVGVVDVDVFNDQKALVAIGRAMMAKPSMLLLDEPSMGLAPQIVAEIFEIVRELNQKEGVSILLAEQNTNVALKYADYGYILESGRVMMDGTAKELAENADVKEFYLGVSNEGRKSFRGMKSYRRRKRWL